MFKIKNVRVLLDKEAVIRCVGQAEEIKLKRLGALLVRDIKKSMKKGGRVKGSKRGVPSPPGTPPHAQSGTLRGSIAFVVEKKTKKSVLVVGVGKEAKYGKVHEFGGRYHPKRPFLAPALYRNKKVIVEAFGRLPLAKTSTGKMLNMRKGRG